jgi:hypothetical protein
MVNRGVDKFVHVVREYCSWAESPRDSQTQNVIEALSILSRLYSFALGLPDVFGEEDAPPIPDEDWKRVYQRFGSLPFNYYSSCFDPHVVPGEEPVVSDAADDLADIWRDLKQGLALYEAGYIEAAVWEWRFHFYIHWGHHAVGVIYAPHCWLAQNSEMLPPNQPLNAIAPKDGAPH